MTYTVQANFGGYVGAEKIYVIDADSEEEALEIVREEALDDLDLEVVNEDF